MGTRGKGRHAARRTVGLLVNWYDWIDGRKLLRSHESRISERPRRKPVGFSRTSTGREDPRRVRGTCRLPTSSKWLARHAALHATDEQIGNLRGALERNLAAETSETFIATDVEFHRAIASISNNRIFEALSAALSEWLTEQRTVSARAGATMEHVRQRHQDIFDAVAQRDAEAAQSAMEIHLHEVIRRYWQDVAPVV